MSEQKPLEQVVMEAIDFCTHTRCKKCEYYGKDSAYGYHGKCRGRMMADRLRKSGVVVREKGEWEDCDWVEYDGHGECTHYPKAALCCSRCRNAFKKSFCGSETSAPTAEQT